MSNSLKDWSGITLKEVAILELAAQGHPNKEIGKILGFTTHTISNYMLIISKKAGVHGRLRTVLFYLHRGNIHPPCPDRDHRDGPI